MVRLDPEHFIYKAHFPGEPITPGVCILQIASELLSLSLGKDVEVRCVRNVKFLQVLVPDKDTCVTFTLHTADEPDDSLRSHITVSANAGTIAKISIICQIVR